MGLVPAFNTLASPGGPLVYSLEAHQFAVYGLEVVSAGQHLLTVSNKFIVFDLASGDIVRTIDPKIEGIMTYLALAPDQRYCVTTTISNQYIICNLLTGEFILRDYQAPPSTNNPQGGGGGTKAKGQKDAVADPLLGAAVSNTHFALWTSKAYQVFTKRGECTLPIKSRDSCASSRRIASRADDALPNYSNRSITRSRNRIGLSIRRCEGRSGCGTRSSDD